MQSLLFERSLGKIDHFQFEQLITESHYFNLDALEFPRFAIKSKLASVNSLAFDNSEHRYLLSGSSDTSVKLWKLGTRRAQLLGDLNKSNLGHTFGVTGVQWWPFDSGMFLSSSYDTTLKVWDSNTLQDAYTFNLDSKVNCFDISQVGDEPLIAAGCDSSHVRILDLRTTSAAHSLSGHNGTILSTKWSSSDSMILATGSSEGEVRIWDIRRTDSCLTQLDLYCTGKETKTNFNNLNKSGSVYKSNVKAHIYGANGLCWLENGKTLLTTGQDDKIRVWDLDAEGGINTLLNFGPFVKNKFPRNKTIVLSPMRETEVQYIWYPSDNGELLIFRLNDGKLVSRLRRGLQDNSRSTCIAYGGNNTAMYYSGTVDGRINVWGPKKDDPVDSSRYQNEEEA